MSRKPRTTYAADLKAKGALAAVKGDCTVNEIASRFGVPANLVSTWKSELFNRASEIFARPATTPTIEESTTRDELFEQIGRLQMDLQWLKKTPLSIEQMRAIIDPDDKDLSVRRQCQVLLHWLRYSENMGHPRRVVPHVFQPISESLLK